MPNPFDPISEANNINKLDFNLNVTGPVSDPSYSYNVDYSTYDAADQRVANHYGDIEAYLTIGEKNQLENILDRLIAEGRSNLP